MLQAWNRLMVRTRSDQRGQSTVEYFLVILAAVALVIIVINLFQSGDTSSGIGGFFSGLWSNLGGWIGNIFGK